jgi:hypothetical protein
MPNQRLSFWVTGSHIAIVAALLVPAGTPVLGKRRAALAGELAV